MFKKFSFLFSFIFVLFFVFSLTAEYKIVGYYPNWAMYRQQPFYPKDIPSDLVTHINYAFVKVDAQGNLSLFDPWADTDHRTDWNTEKPYWGNFLQLTELKKENPHLKTLFSVGGWTLSDPFSALAENPQARKNFIAQVVQFAEKYGFDGVDIDWEYPGFAEHSGRPQDKENFTLLLQELSKVAKEHQPPLLVTIAAPAGPKNYKNIELEKIHSYLDWINLMGYDFNGAWGGAEDITNHNAPLYPTEKGDPQFNVDSAIRYYLSQGVPKEKLVLGMPLYGRSFAGAEGLYGSYTGVGEGTTEEAGMRFFYDIKNNLLGDYIRFWDDQAKVPYLYNPKNKEFISYDDEESLAIKSQYVREMGLGGAMVWELSLDHSPEWSGIRTIHQKLNKN